jgi:glycine cleavage system aminomethyltransferase T
LRGDARRNSGPHFRISFSGELSYEINVPADYGRAMWEKLMAAGAPFGISPYGTEAMGVLRIEKGHVAGHGTRRPHHARRSRAGPARK